MDDNKTHIWVKDKDTGKTAKLPKHTIMLFPGKFELVDGKDCIKCGVTAKPVATEEEQKQSDSQEGKEDNSNQEASKELTKRKAFK